MSRSLKRAPRTFGAALLAVAMLAVVAGCTPPTDSPSGPNPSAQFCEFWEAVEETPPTSDTAVVVKEDVVALADDAAVIGSDCAAPAARVELDGAVVAEGEEIPSEQGNASSEPIAAITGDEISAGAPVLDNLQLTALSATIDANGITLRGNVAVTLSGVTSTIGFVGTLRDLQNWSIGLSSSGLTIPGIVSTPVVFSGQLRMSNGVPSLTLSARATAAKIGDITVNSAAIDLAASPATGVQASVAGDIKVGPSTVNGRVDVDFDSAGTLVSANADLSAHLVGTQADGKRVDLTGTVKLEGNARETVASFSGHGVVGDLVVHEANGSLTLGTNRATFVGVLDVEQGANTLRFNGSLVWDGRTAHIPFLTLEGAGEISGVLEDGQRLSVAGTMSAEVIGGQLRSVITGNFQLGSLKASGSAVVETNGITTSLELSASLVGAGFGANIEGAIVITDGRAEMVALDAAVSGNVNMGDVSLTGATLRVRSSYGSPLDISFAGGIKVGTRADLNGAITASIGPNGTLLSLRGDISGSLALDTWGIANFNGSIIATVDQVTISGSGGISLINFPLGLQLNGTLTSSLTRPSWTLHGAARLRLGPIDVIAARLQLSQTEGMKATRVGFYFSILGIPTYFEGDFYMRPTGGCDKVNITGGGPIAKLILVTVLPGAIGCPVHI